MFTFSIVFLLMSLVCIAFIVAVGYFALKIIYAIYQKIREDLK